MKYRYLKANYEVEAMQVTDALFDDPHPNPAHMRGEDIVYDPDHRCVRVEMLQGTTFAHIGDWVIRYPSGVLMLATDSVFKREFEKV